MLFGRSSFFKFCVYGTFRKNLSSIEIEKETRNLSFWWAGERRKKSKFFRYMVVICKSFVSSLSEFMLLLVNDIGTCITIIIVDFFYLEHTVALGLIRAGFSLVEASRRILKSVNHNRKLEISTAPTKAKSRVPACMQLQRGLGV